MPGSVLKTWHLALSGQSVDCTYDGVEGTAVTSWHLALSGQCLLTANLPARSPYTRVPGLRVHTDQAGSRTCSQETAGVQLCSQGTRPTGACSSDFFESQNPKICCCLVAKSCPTVCHPMDSSPAGSSVHRLPQARTLEWVATSSSRGSSRPSDGTHVSCIARRILYHRATRQAPTQDYF